jgi:hypothetical protein
VTVADLTPPPELVRQWFTEWHCDESIDEVDSKIYLANRAAKWGADIELEACCEWLDGNNPHTDAVIADLRAARRPRPLTLAEEALEALDKCGRRGHYVTDSDYWDPIISALKRLAELEHQATPRHSL